MNVDLITDDDEIPAWRKLLPVLTSFLEEFASSFEYDEDAAIGNLLALHNCSWYGLSLSPAAEMQQSLRVDNISSLFSQS